MDLNASEGGLFTRGTLIANRYEVVSVLGTGAMGTVVRVIDRALDNEVCALKLLHPHQARDKTNFARFRNEVILARRLGHPNIARLYDIGQAGGGYYYISMEYISGGSLNQIIYQQRREHQVFRDNVRMLCEIADGIAYAHKLGVVHRDLKPENILLGDRSEIKITDFGLARSLSADRGFTDTGETVGTPCYMAPEQLRGERVDGRCDIYALGIIAFELVVGRRPFFDESYFALAAMHMRVPIPDFATKESGIPKWFEDFVKRCAAKEPGERYQDAYQIVEELRDRMRSQTAETQVRRSPAVFSFYAPTPGKRTLPDSFRSFLRWIAVGASLFAIVWGLLSLNGTDFSSALRNMQESLSGTKTSITSPSELFAIIERGDDEQLRNLLKTDPAISKITYLGDTPLIAAARSGRTEIAKTLLEFRANPNSTGAQGLTALMHAVQRPGRLVADALIEAHADVNARDAAGNTALIHAARRGNTAAVQLLIEKRATVNSRNERGQSALFEAVLRKEPALVQLLLSQNADPNIQDGAGRNPLSYAAENDDEASIRALLQKGGDPNLRDLSDRTPADYAGKRSKKLFSATSKGSSEIQSGPIGAGNEQTRLRVVGEIQLAFESTASGARKIVRGTIKNFGSSPAKQISVALQTSDGKSINLQGPAEIQANESAQFSAVVPDTFQAGSRDRLVPQCSNCYK